MQSRRACSGNLVPLSVCPPVGRLGGWPPWCWCPPADRARCSSCGRAPLPWASWGPTVSSLPAPCSVLRAAGPVVLPPRAAQRCGLLCAPGRCVTAVFPADTFCHAAFPRPGPGRPPPPRAPGVLALRVCVRAYTGFGSSVKYASWHPSG